MGDRKREMQYPSQERRLGGDQIAPLAVVLTAHRLICVRAALPGTGNQILFAFSLVGGAHQRQASENPVLIEGLWFRPDCSMWQGLRAGKAKASCAVHSPRFACTCTWAEVSANVSSRKVISDTSLWLVKWSKTPESSYGLYANREFFLSSGIWS